MTALILGATSDIGEALARRLSLAGFKLQLSGRDSESLKAMKSDIEIRTGVSVISFELNALNFDTHYPIYHDLEEKPDIAILVFGYLGDHAKATENWEESARIINTNYVGAVSILNVIANDFQERKAGVIVGISSVAGDRGRMSNYLYGSAKAGLTTYLSGLRNRLFHSDVHVLTVKPGFVRTRMTEGLKLPKLVTADPDQLAKRIISAIQKKRNTIYVLQIWSFIMLLIRNMPEFLFKRMKL